MVSIWDVCVAEGLVLGLNRAPYFGNGDGCDYTQIFASNLISCHCDFVGGATYESFLDIVKVDLLLDAAVKGDASDGDFVCGAAVVGSDAEGIILAPGVGCFDNVVPLFDLERRVLDLERLLYSPHP